MTIATESTTSQVSDFKPCMPGCDPKTCHDCTDQKVARNDEEMLNFTVIHTIFGIGLPTVTTTFNSTLGWSTQIDGGVYDKKLWVAKSRRRADYHHRIAVEMVINFRRKTNKA